MTCLEVLVNFVLIIGMRIHQRTWLILKDQFPDFIMCFVEALFWRHSISTVLHAEVVQILGKLNAISDSALRAHLPHPTFQTLTATATACPTSATTA